MTMKFGILGGSGLYNTTIIKQLEWLTVDTPFGKPSDQILRGKVGDREVYFIPRHGRGHVLSPSEVNHRANIFALKALGVNCVISVSAVGSLREEIKPRDVVIPDQYFDRTKRPEAHTFFGDGVVAHVSFGEPLCPVLRKELLDATGDVLKGDAFKGQSVHDGGTYVNMEGPAFSTRAESNFYRQCGFSIIGMTSLAEAKLAREAELCYCPIAMITDYDCWREGEDDVHVDMVLEHLRANVRLAEEVLVNVIENSPETRTCFCGDSLKHALITRPDMISGKQKERLAPIIGRYIL